MKILSLEPWFSFFHSFILFLFCTIILLLWRQFFLGTRNLLPWPILNLKAFPWSRRHGWNWTLSLVPRLRYGKETPTLKLIKNIKYSLQITHVLCTYASWLNTYWHILAHSFPLCSDSWCYFISHQCWRSIAFGFFFFFFFLVGADEPASYQAWEMLMKVSQFGWYKTMRL